MSKKMEQINSELQKMREIAGNSQSSEAEYQKQQYVNARHEIAQSVYNKYFGDLQSESLKKTANKKKAEKTQKPKIDKIVEESTPESDTPQGKKDYTDWKLKDIENKEVDWTDASARKAYEEERRRLQAQVDSAGAQLAQAEDTKTISSMSEDDKNQLERYGMKRCRPPLFPV